MPDLPTEWLDKAVLQAVQDEESVEQAERELICQMANERFAESNNT